MKRMLSLAIFLSALTIGVLGGCDAAVKTTVLDGLQTGATSIAEALITAGFQTFENNGTDSGTTGF